MNEGGRYHAKRPNGFVHLYQEIEGNALIRMCDGAREKEDVIRVTDPLNCFRCNRLAEITPSIAITVPYMGCEGWSVNHYKVGGNMAWKRSPEATVVRKIIGLMLNTELMKTEWKPKAPLHIIISGTFRDRRHVVDMHNCCKVVLDCVQDATGVDDRSFQVTTELPKFSHDVEPEIRIEVRQC